MILENGHMSWAWYWYHVILKSFLFLAKLARSKMSQCLKLVFECFSKMKMHTHSHTRTSKSKYCQMLSNCWKGGGYTLHTPLFNCLSILNGSHKIWGNSIIIIFCAGNSSSKFGLWECLRLAISLPRFLPKLSLPESVHPHTSRPPSWMASSQPWPYASQVIKTAFTRLIWGAGTPSKHLMKLPDSLTQVSRDLPVLTYTLKRTNISFVSTNLIDVFKNSIP